MLLYILYTVILIYVTTLIFIEFFHEKKWKNQIALAFVLLIFVLRILQIK